MINKKRLIKLTQKLIRINSENPPGDESRIASFAKNYLANLGLAVKIYEFKRKRPNLIAYLGRGNESLLITPHLDTVPAGRNWKFDPFSGAIFQDRIYGLGATDCKGNLAVSMEVLNSLVEENALLNYRLIFAATADEEAGSRLGLAPLLNKGILKPDAALVLDTDDFGIVVSQKGLIHLKVKIKGKRSHGAYPWLGINAIDISLNVLKDLKSEFASHRRTKYLKPQTVNIGTIKGGDKVNVVADWCEFELDFRFLPETSPQGILRDLRRIIKKYTQKLSRQSGIPLKAGKIEIEGIQKPYHIDQRHPLVGSLVSAMRNMGIRPVIKGSEGATTITFFQNKNIPAVATGFGSEGCAHTVNEYAKVENLYKGAIVLENFLKNYGC